MRLLILVLVFAAAPGFGGDWSPRLAAQYLDSRQKDWFGWKTAAASGGPCVSCHTGLTYLLARPALRMALGETQPTPYETGLRAGLHARLEKKDNKPAVAVESVLAALLLQPDDPQPFDRLWSLQMEDGAWAWFSLNLDPWEMPESRFYGAALAALAVGNAPAANPDRVALLTAYLRREQEAQPLHNRLILLWAASKLPQAIPEPLRQPLIGEIWRRQQPDGGWTMESLGPWKTHSGAPPTTGSNSYATALVSFVLRQAGVAGSHPGLIRALGWLRAHQNPKSGAWPADSMNKHYEPGSMPLQFMQDAATGFAVLALLGTAQVIE
jgi:squalene-hopene/tetraprenyl-beta-curcumene cyclase